MSPRHLCSQHRIWFIVVLGLLVFGDALSVSAQSGANRILGQVDFTHNGVNIVTNSGLWTPSSVAVDRSVSPNRLYVADSGNHRVLAWRSIAALKNGAPADLVIGQPDFLSWSAQCNNAAVTGETLCFPSAVAVNRAGDLYVVDRGNNRVLEYDDPFSTDTLPDLVFGQGGSFTSGACNKGGAITAATLCNPLGVATDSVGNVYISDAANSRVLEYDLPLVTDVAADRVFGQGGSFTSGICNKNGVSALSLCSPADIALDPAGNMYVGDPGNFRVLEYNVPFGSGAAGLVFGQGNNFSNRDDPCSSTPTIGALCSPSGVATDSGGNLYISDSTFSRIQEYTRPSLTALTTPNAVFGQPDFNSGRCNSSSLTPASVCLPAGMASDQDDDLFVADFGNQRVLEYFKPLATNPPNTTAGLVLGQMALTRNGVNLVKPNSLYWPVAVALDASVSPNRLYVADTSNSRVLGWHSVAAFTNGAPADLVLGQPDFFSAGCNQNRVDAAGNSLAAAGTLCFPGGVAVDGAGNLWVADSTNFRVLKYNAPFASGLNAGQQAVVVLGQHGSFTSRIENNGGVNDASMSAPAGLALDAAGALYVADPNNNRVLKFNHPSAGNAAADAVFGQGGNFTGNLCNFHTPCERGGCSATADSLCRPAAVAVSAGQALYIADTANNRVLQFPPAQPANPVANLVIGQPNFIASACATLCRPMGLAVNASGDLYAADGVDSRIKAYKTPLTNNPPANLVIGTSLCGQAAARADTLCGVSGIGLDSPGNLYAADTLDDRVLEFNHPVIPSPTPTPTGTPAPTPTSTPSGTPTPKQGFPFIRALPEVIQPGAVLGIEGSGFTQGSRVDLFVATTAGPINVGPWTPSAFSPIQLDLMVPANIPLGEGVASVQVVNTDRGYARSNVVLALLQGNPALGIPSLTGIDSTGIAADSTSPGVAEANVQTVVVQGTTVTLNGTGFDAANGVAVDLFCACAHGKVGPFFISPSLKLSSTEVLVNIPGSGPNAPVTGPGSFVVSNRGADGRYRKKSNALSVPIGQRITVSAVSQSGKQVTVFGSGFSIRTVINLFNAQGAVAMNLGGLNSNGSSRIPLNIINQGEFTFTVPAAAVPGPAFVQAINPPFVEFTSSGNSPHGAFTLK